jgi:hypothetical protein
MHNYNFYRILGYDFKSLIYSILYHLNYHYFPSNSKSVLSFNQLDSQGITGYFKRAKALKNIIYVVFSLKYLGLLPINHLKALFTLGEAREQGFLESK